MITLLSLSVVVLVAQAENSWIRSSWNAGEDHAFQQVRNRMEKLQKDARPHEVNEKLRLEFTDSFRRWSGDRTNVLHLYQATYSLMVARSVDCAFEPNLTGSSRANDLVKGWRNIMAPRSYEFSRLGFAFVGGFVQDISLLDLYDRLRVKEPFDPWVVPACVSEVFYKGASTERRLQVLALSQRLVKEHPERPRSLLTLAVAYQCEPKVGRRREAFGKALQCLKLYLASAPSKCDHDSVRQWALDIERQILNN